jgi:hypothetical protein
MDGGRFLEEVLIVDIIKVKLKLFDIVAGNTPLELTESTSSRRRLLEDSPRKIEVHILAIDRLQDVSPADGRLSLVTKSLSCLDLVI